MTDTPSLHDQDEALLAQLECTSDGQEPFNVDRFVHRLLAIYHKVAVPWCVDDVQSERPDLTDDQAWDVLQQCKDEHDPEFGFTWDLIRGIADDLFPRPPGQRRRPPFLPGGEFTRALLQGASPDQTSAVNPPSRTEEEQP
jgi:hypothetical protein